MQSRGLHLVRIGCRERIGLDDLQRLRTRIDEIDQQIVQLLKTRYENARLLARVKQARGLDLRDFLREKIILAKIDHLSTHLGLDPKLVERVFGEIFRLSLEAQRNISSPSHPNLHGLSVLVIGGTGGMGRFLARFCSLLGGEVRIAGRSLRNTRRGAKELEVEPGTVQDAATSDIVFISVPMQETERVALETASLMKDGSLISDISSVKTGISDRIAARIQKNIEFVSIHPLFGPDADHLNDQNIIAVPYLAGPRWGRLDRALKAAGARIYSMTATRHDRKMAYVQGLHHFAMINLGLSLDTMGPEPKTSSLRDTEAKIEKLLNSWETIAGIQKYNPFVHGLQQRFMETSERTMRMSQREFSRVRSRLGVNVQKWSRKQ